MCTLNMLEPTSAILVMPGECGVTMVEVPCQLKGTQHAAQCLYGPQFVKTNYGLEYIS